MVFAEVLVDRPRWLRVSGAFVRRMVDLVVMCMVGLVVICVCSVVVTAGGVTGEDGASERKSNPKREPLRNEVTTGVITLSGVRGGSCHMRTFRIGAVSERKIF